MKNKKILNNQPRYLLGDKGVHTLMRGRLSNDCGEEHISFESAFFSFFSIPNTSIELLNKNKRNNLFIFILLIRLLIKIYFKKE
jgi:hypothetical protein